MKRVAILQSNYIPWKGYFDVIAAVDEFILYDDVQFTKNDWRNRNRIKTPTGVSWLSIPVGQDINRLICEVELKDKRWQTKHWATLQQNYARANCFENVSRELKGLYLEREYSQLSEVNRVFIQFVCKTLGIQTKISNSWDYAAGGGQTERLLQLCEQAGATEYVSGPAARSYIDETAFAERDIALSWFDYSGYPEYTQLWGDFAHDVSILDLLFNCGDAAPDYMKFVRK